MSQKPCIPEPERYKYLLANLRKTKLEMKEFNLELDEIIALLEQTTRERQIQRVKISLDNISSLN